MHCPKAQNDAPEVDYKQKVDLRTLLRTSASLSWSCCRRKSRAPGSRPTNRSLGCTWRTATSRHPRLLRRFAHFANTLGGKSTWRIGSKAHALRTRHTGLTSARMSWSNTWSHNTRTNGTNTRHCRRLTRSCFSTGSCPATTRCTGTSRLTAMSWHSRSRTLSLIRSLASSCSGPRTR